MWEEASHPTQQGWSTGVPWPGLLAAFPGKLPAGLPPEQVWAVSFLHRALCGLDYMAVNWSVHILSCQASEFKQLDCFNKISNLFPSYNSLPAGFHSESFREKRLGVVEGLQAVLHLPSCGRHNWKKTSMSAAQNHLCIWKYAEEVQSQGSGTVDRRLNRMDMCPWMVELTKGMCNSPMDCAPRSTSKS